MDISQETRRQILALYIGADVIAPHPYEDGEKLPGYLTGIHGEMEAEVQHLEDGNVWEEPEYHDFVNTVLQLKPLSSITDEDAIALTKIYRTYCFKDNDERIETGKSIVQLGRDDRMFTMEQFTFIADYLRSKGYALPACGFTVEELVKAGIFKLKEVSNG